MGIDLGSYFVIVNGNCQIHMYDVITYMYIWDKDAHSLPKVECIFTYQSGDHLSCRAREEKPFVIRPPPSLSISPLPLSPLQGMYINYTGLTLVPVHSQRVPHSCWGCSLLSRSSWSEQTTSHHHCY